jgi:hypothetical protein
MKKLLFVASIAVTLMPVGAFAAKKPNENIGHLIYDHGYWRPWSKIVADATVMSARHNVENRGHPLKFHSCEPEDKQKCSDSIIIGLDNNDPPWKFMVVITDRDQGVETGRLCWFTADHKTRQCMAWGDPGDGPIEKFNDAGEWVIEGKDSATEDFYGTTMDSFADAPDRFAHPRSVEEYRRIVSDEVDAFGMCRSSEHLDQCLRAWHAYVKKFAKERRKIELSCHHIGEHEVSCHSD